MLFKLLCVHHINHMYNVALVHVHHSFVKTLSIIRNVLHGMARDMIAPICISSSRNFITRLCDCVKYFSLYSLEFIQLLITHTKIKWVNYIPTFITNAESTANKISLLYFVELVVIALLFANWIVTLLLIQQESQFRFVSYKWNRISGSHEKQRREAQEGHSGWWATCFGSRWGDACESQCIDRWDLEGHEARSAGGVRREWVYLVLSKV